MKKIYLLLTVVFATLIMTSCGMTPEEIDAAIAQLDTTYQTGAYNEAQQEITALEKAYKKMTDEQKSGLDKLKDSVNYAVSSVENITSGLNNAQSFYDRQMYYEANHELENLAASYTLPPAEQKMYDEKKAAVDTAIKNWQITEAMQKSETALSSGDYNTAANELAVIDAATLSEEQKQQYDSLQSRIAQAKAKAEAEAKAKAEAEARKVKTTQKAISLAKSVNNRDGMDDYLGNVYTCSDCGSYYLVKVSATKNANGQSRYKVYKETGKVEFLGSASEGYWDE